MVKPYRALKVVWLSRRNKAPPAGCNAASGQNCVERDRVSHQMLTQLRPLRPPRRATDSVVAVLTNRGRGLNSTLKAVGCAMRSGARLA